MAGDNKVYVDLRIGAKHNLCLLWRHNAVQAAFIQPVTRYALWITCCKLY